MKRQENNYNRIVRKEDKKAGKGFEVKSRGNHAFTIHLDCEF